jgi:8-oxo-dGTP diphosphatase
MEIHECVSFLLVDSGKVLLEKRSILKESDPGLITIPGGHIEQGESHTDALVRELEEELGIQPKSFGFLCSLYHITTELQLIHYYVVTSWSGEMKVLEADEISWYQINQAPVGIEADQVALSEYSRIIRTQVIKF